MLWTGSTMASSTPPVPPKSARYLSVWSYGHVAPRPTGSGRPLEISVDASHDGWAASASGAAPAAAAGAPWPVSWVRGPDRAEDLLQTLVQSLAVAPGATLVVYASSYEVRPYQVAVQRSRTLDWPVVSPIGSPRVAIGEGVAPDPDACLHALSDKKKLKTKSSDSPC